MDRKIQKFNPNEDISSLNEDNLKSLYGLTH